MSALPTGWAKTQIDAISEFNPKTIADDSLKCAFSSMQYLGTRFRASMGYEERVWGDIKKAYVHFRSNDVIVAKVTPCFENGKAGVVPDVPNGIGAGSSEFCVFRPAPGIDERYLLAWLSTEDFRRRATVAMTGSVGLKRVPKDFFLSEEISLAPFHEQRRIAEKLDTILTRVDALNDRLARIAPLLKRFRQSVLAAATSGRLSERWMGTSAPYKKISINEISEARLGKMLDKEKNTGELVQYLRNVNVRWFSFDLNNLFEMRVERSELADLSIKNDDVLICEGGEPGRCAVWKGGETHLVFQKALHRIRTDQSKLLPDWLAINIKHQANSGELDQLFTGSTIKHLTGSSLSKLAIPIPSVAEQTEIIRRVEILFAYADRLEARLQTARTAADRLTPALLAKAFRGELVPQDPNDEPATELLRRLREARDAEAPAKKARGRKAQVA